MIQARWRRRGMVAFGVLCLPTGAVLLAEDPGAGVALLAFGVACVTMGLIRPAEAGDVGGVEPGTVSLPDGRTLRGTWLLASKRRANVAIFSCFVIAIAGVGFAASGKVVLGVITAALFGAAGVLGLRNGAPSVLLAPEGILAGDGRTFLAWGDIAEVRLRDVRGNLLLDLVPVERSAVQTSAVTRALLRLNRGNVSIGLGVLRVDADLAYDVVVRLMEDPAERRLIGSSDGVAALETLRRRHEG